jgi:hypothetical protein
MDIIFGTWYVGSLYWAGSLITVASKLAKCNFDLMAIQEVRWDEGSSHPADDYTFFYGNGNANHHLETDFFVWKGIISAVKKFISDRILYITLRGHWCDIVWNVHASTEDESDELKDGICEETECVFDQFLEYHMKMLVGDFNSKTGREDILKPTIRN